MNTLQLLAISITAVAGMAFADNNSPMVGDTSLGKVLTTEQGMTLYMFTKDTDKTSACYDGCAAKWPPLLAEQNESYPEAGYSTNKRTDGTFQWAYQGQPLYTWVKDQKAGDTSGQGVGGVWFVVEAK